MTFNIQAQLLLRPPTNVAQIGTQIRNQLNNITAGINITVNQRGQRAANQAGNSLKNVGKNAKDAGDRIKYFGEQIGYATKRFFAFTVGTAAILRFVGALKEGVSEAIAFERELVKVAQVTGRTIKGVGNLSKEITRLSKGLGVSSSELVQASRVLAQTGIAADEVKTALEALAKSDLAPTFDNINNTTEASIAIFRQFGKEAKDLEGILGSINAVAGRFAVESSDIAAAVRRTGGAFAAAGGDLNELIALFTSVRATTRESAESIATGFRTIFTRLQRVRTQNFLETVGINLKNLEGQFIGPFEAVRKLSAALEALPSTDPRFAQIVEELGGFRQVSKVIPLVQQFGTAEKALGVALAGTNSLTEDSELAQQSLANQLRKTRESFAAMIRELTNTKTFKDLVTLALTAANAFIKMAEALKPLLPLLVGLGGLAIGKLLPTVFAGIKNVPGLNKGGMVDVVLTPGERVFTPSEVNKVGLKNLEKANRRGFATGGFVPGTGNRDTVPAVLPEGSFVLRKSVAQKFNKGGIVDLPKFANGTNTIFSAKQKVSTKEIPDFDPKSKDGSVIFVKDSGPGYGAVVSEARSEKAGGSQGVQPRISINNLRPAFSRVKKKGVLDKYELGIVDGTKFSVSGGSSVGFSFPVGFVKKTSEKIIRSETEPKLKQLVSDMTESVLPFARQKSTPVPNQKAIIGSLFEGMIRNLGAPFLDNEDSQEKDSAIWDFPQGIKGKAAAIFDNGSVRTIPTDAKYSLNAAQKGLKGKVENTIADKLASSPGKVVNNFVLRKKLGPTGPQTKGAKGGLMKFADGGMVPNALLTPGERVFSPEEVNQIGLGNLQRANRTGFAAGGAVGFKPKLTTRGRGEGNVGRKKQYLDQLITYMERAQQAGELDEEGKRYLASQKAKKSKGINVSRTKRFSNRLAGQGSAYLPRPAVFRKGGLVGLRRGGSVRKYATGGGILGGGGAGSIAAFSLATGAISGMVSQMESASDSFKTVVNTLTTFATQVGVITFGLSSLGKAAGGTGRALEIAQIKLKSAQQGLDINQRKLQTATDPAQQQKLRKNIVGSQKAIAVQQDAIKKTQKLEKNIGFAAAGVAVLGAAAQSAANVLEKLGRADIEAGGTGGKLVAAKTVGGASQGANLGGAAGLAIGSIIPGIGPLIGAGIGTLLGGALGTQFGLGQGKQAQFEAIQTRDFGESLKQLEYTFKDLGANLTTFEQQLPALQGFVNQARNQLADPRTTAESRKNLRAQAAQQLEGFNKVISESTKTVVKNNREGDKVAQVYSLAGRDLIRFTAELQGISYERAEQQIRNNIVALEEAREAQDKLSKLTDQYAERIKNVTNLSRAFDTVALSLQKFEAQLSTTLDFAGGGTGAFQLFDESARLATPQNFFDAEGFNRVLQRDIANNFVLKTRFPGATQDAGQQLAQDVSQAEAAIRNLPAILLNLKNSAGSFDPEDIISQLVDKFQTSGQTSGQKSFVQKTIEKAARAVLGSEGKPQKFIDELSNDLPGLAKKLGAGFDDILKVTAQISKALNDEGNRRLKLVDTITKLTDQEIALRQRGIDLQSNAEDLRARAGNRPTDLNRLQQLDNQRLTTITGGGSIDPAQIGANVRASQKRISEIQEKYAKVLADDSTDASKKLNDELIKQRDTVLRGNQALDFLSNVSDRAATTMEEFSREQAIANARLGLIDRAISAETPKEIMQFTRELAQARMAVADGRIDRVRPQDRSEVFNFLKSLPDNFELGGQTIKDALIDIRTNFLADRGFDPQEARRIAVGQTEKSNQLQTQLTTIITAAEEAYNQQLLNFGKTQADIIKALDTSINTFTQKLQDIINQQKKDDLTKQLQGVEGSLSSALSAEKTLQDLALRFGGDPNKDFTTRLERAQKVLATREDIAKLYKVREAEKSFKPFVESVLESQSLGFFEGYENVGQFTQDTANIQIGDKTLRDYLVKPYSDSVISPEYSVDRGMASKVLEQEIARIFEETGSLAAKQAFEESFNKQGGLSAAEFDSGRIDAFKLAQQFQTARQAGAKRLEQDYNQRQFLEGRIEERTGLSIEELTPEIREIGKNAEAINKAFLSIEKYIDTTAKRTIEKLVLDLNTFSGKVNSINEQLIDLGVVPGGGNQRGGIIGFNKGGVVPGFGNRDSVLAALTPGEVVLPKMATGGLIDEFRKLEKEGLKHVVDDSRYRDLQKLVSKDRLAKYTNLNLDNIDKVLERERARKAQYSDRKTDVNKDMANRGQRYLDRYYKEKQIKKDLEKSSQLGSYGIARPSSFNTSPIDIEKERQARNQVQAETNISAADIQNFKSRRSAVPLRTPNLIVSQEQKKLGIFDRGAAFPTGNNRFSRGLMPEDTGDTLESVQKRIQDAAMQSTFNLVKGQQNYRNRKSGGLKQRIESYRKKIDSVDKEIAKTKQLQNNITSGPAFNPKLKLKSLKEYKDSILKSLDDTMDFFFPVEKGGKQTAGPLLKKFGFQTGAFVPGQGSGDKISAMLEPGEYVFNRQAVKAIGKENLDSMNFNKFPRFQRGGPVKMQQGGETPQTTAASMPDFTFFNEIIQNFGNKVDLLAETMNSINGLSIEHYGNFKHEIIINGAQVLTEIMPQVTKIVENKISESMNRVLKDNFNGKAGTYE
jgi:TP901 family phage tail tape measure protein